MDPTLPEQSSTTVLVTGAARGIGRAVAVKLAQQGCRVAVNYRGDTRQAESVCREIEENGGLAMIVKADVTDSHQVDEMIKTVNANWGDIDILVNNAGLLRDGHMIMMSDSQWHEVVNTNLTGNFYVTRAAARAMMQNKSGCIINIASISGLIGTPGQCNYSASKGGVVSMTRALARELAKYRVRVNAVAPGFIETDMISAMPDKHLKKYVDAIPLGRVGRAQEVANAVAFLAAAQSEYITGHVLVVDGGLSA